MFEFERKRWRAHARARYDLSGESTVR